MFKGDFYHIEDLVSSNNEFTALIALNPDHLIFKGHFPGQPIVPGVMLSQMLKEIVEEVSEKKLQLKKASNIKFLHLLEPGKHSTFTFSGSFEEVAVGLKVKATAMDGEVVFFKMAAVFGF